MPMNATPRQSKLRGDAVENDGGGDSIGMQRGEISSGGHTEGYTEEDKNRKTRRNVGVDLEDKRRKLFSSLLHTSRFIHLSS